MVGARQTQQPDFFQAGSLQSAIDHLGDGVDRPLSHRTGDYTRLTEPTTTGTTPEDFHRITLMDSFSHRHDGTFRILPLVEIHDGVLGNGIRSL